MIEKGFQIGVTEPFCCLLCICGKFGQESKNIVRSYGFYISFTELDLKIAKDIAVITNRIFFWNWSCDNQENVEQLALFSWYTSVVWVIMFWPIP